MTDQDSNAPQGLPSAEQLAAVALARLASTAITEARLRDVFAERRTWQVSFDPKRDYFAYADDGQVCACTAIGTRPLTKTDCRGDYAYR